jgi:curved DNA-binding protein CbpA
MLSFYKLNIRNYHKNIDYSINFYQLLGLTNKASENEIKTSYRKLAKQYHPDANKDMNAIEKFKEITSAYEVLNDKNKKAIYDKSMNITNMPFKYTNYENEYKSYRHQSNLYYSKLYRDQVNNNYKTNASTNRAKASYIFRDNMTGEYKTYYFDNLNESTTNNNIYYNDFNAALKRKRMRREYIHNDYKINNQKTENNNEELIYIKLIKSIQISIIIMVFLYIFNKLRKKSYK